jgi:hypothetical protein
MNVFEVKKWSEKVIEQLKYFYPLESTEFTFLAGEKYRKYLLPNMVKTKIPLRGLAFGKQLKKLNELIACFKKASEITGLLRNITPTKISQPLNKCGLVHSLMEPLERYYFPFEDLTIPLNGVYVLFENKESGHNNDRIVRIGTHTGKNQLRKRLKEHFLNPNKDRSIFRKNIGRAILSTNKDPFLNYWELDLTSRIMREKYSSQIDFNYQKEIENKVTKYIQHNFSFVVFEVRDKSDRLDIESKLISTVSLCNKCYPSNNWLGKKSPKEKIVSSGLWQEKELYKVPFDNDGINSLSLLIKG